MSCQENLFQRQVEGDEEPECTADQTDRTEELKGFCRKALEELNGDQVENDLDGP